jgi:hypothetical protein
MNYSDVFSKKRMLNIDLQNKDTYNKIYNNGYHYISRFYFGKLFNVLRFPTIGFYVELFKYPQPGAIRIDSNDGKKLIKKLCYF